MQMGWEQEDCEQWQMVRGGLLVSFFVITTAMIMVTITTIIPTASNTMIPPANTPIIKFELIRSKKKKEKV